MEIETESEIAKTFSSLPNIKGQIQFKNVEFKYSEKNDRVFSDLSFEAKAGDFVVVTGANGSGKASILKLVQAMHTPTNGSIFIDGFDIRQLDAPDLRRRIDSKQLLDKLQRHFPETNQLEYNQASKKNSDPVIFNWQNLNDATDGDPRLNQNIIAIFIEHLDNDMQALNDAYDKNDFKAWDEWAHKIYGACANIGAEYLAKICDEAQSLSTSLTDQPRIHMLQKEIEKAYSILKNEIMEFQGI